jgi:chorismate mutase/prephenate dehydratase
MSESGEGQGGAVGLDALRSQIDSLDDQLLELLDGRARLVQKVAEVKQAQRRESFYEPTRERQILDRMTERSRERGGPFPTGAVRTVFQEVISACLSLEQPLQIAYLGPEATFTHMACKRQFGLSARLTPVGSIGAVFEEVDRGLAALGVVPIENSTEGVVNHTLDTFLTSDLRICAEIVLEVSHCLLARSEDTSVIEKVYSHPQAVGQCRNWLQQNLPRATIVEVASTSLAAQLAQGDARSAAIASEMAASLYGLTIVRRKLEDVAENVTRFLVVGKSGRKPTGHDKTSIMFSIKDQPGVLFRVLAAFADEGVNLTRIESRPSRRRPWDYIFFVDLDGHAESAEVARALAKLGESCDFVKVLGSYPKADGAPPRAGRAEEPR